MGRLERLLETKYHLPGRHFATKQREIESKLRILRREAGELAKNVAGARVTREQKLASDLALAKLALLRWDELDELASHLSAVLKSQSPPSRKKSSRGLQNTFGKGGDLEGGKNKNHFLLFRRKPFRRRENNNVNYH